MVCQECNREIPDRYDFCPYCGKRVKIRRRICPKCGLVALPTEDKCDGCGYYFSEDENKPSENTENAENQPTEAEEKSLQSTEEAEESLKEEEIDRTEDFIKFIMRDKKILILFAVFSVLVIIILISIMKLIFGGKKNTQNGDIDARTKVEVIHNPSQYDVMDVNYNLYHTRAAELKGRLYTTEGRRVLRLYDPISVYSADAEGKSILLSNVTDVGFDFRNTPVRSEHIASMPDNTSLVMTGNLSIISEEVVFFPEGYTIVGTVNEASEGENIEKRDRYAEGELTPNVDLQANWQESSGGQNLAGTSYGNGTDFLYSSSREKESSNTASNGSGTNGSGNLVGDGAYAVTGNGYNKGSAVGSANGNNGYTYPVGATGDGAENSLSGNWWEDEELLKQYGSLEELYESIKQNVVSDVFNMMNGYNNGNAEDNALYNPNFGNGSNYVSGYSYGNTNANGYGNGNGSGYANGNGNGYGNGNVYGYNNGGTANYGGNNGAQSVEDMYNSHYDNQIDYNSYNKDNYANPFIGIYNAIVNKYLQNFGSSNGSLNGNNAGTNNNNANGNGYNSGYNNNQNGNNSGYGYNQNGNNGGYSYNQNGNGSYLNGMYGNDNYQSPFGGNSNTGNSYLGGNNGGSSWNGASSSGYIFPNSSKVRLTDADIANLNIQQLNYAKNEIYARHGRKFLSDELQSYFEGKTWYRGTVDANSFSDSVLNDIEKDNIELLRAREYAIDPNGYSLD